MQAVTEMFPKFIIVVAMAAMLSAAGIVQARYRDTAQASVQVRPRTPTSARAKPTWNEMNVPQHSAWAKNVLLIVVWMFVLAVLTGPLVKYVASRQPLPRPPGGGAW